MNKKQLTDQGKYLYDFLYETGYMEAFQDDEVCALSEILCEFVPEWKPVSIAPCGEQLFIYCSDGFITTGIKFKNDLFTTWFFRGESKSAKELGYTPTHWMSIPKLPTVIKKREAKRS